MRLSKCMENAGGTIGHVLPSTFQFSLRHGFLYYIYFTRLSMYSKHSQSILTYLKFLVILALSTNKISFLISTRPYILKWGVTSQWKILHVCKIETKTSDIVTDIKFLVSFSFSINIIFFLIIMCTVYI